MPQISVSICTCTKTQTSVSIPEVCSVRDNMQVHRVLHEHAYRALAGVRRAGFDPDEAFGTRPRHGLQQPLSALNPLIKAAKTVDSTRNAHAHAQRTRATLVSYGHRPHEHRPHEHRPHEHRPHEHRPHEHTRSQAQVCRRAGAGRTGAAACAQALAGAGCTCTLPGSVQFPAPGLPAASTNAGYPCCPVEERIIWKHPSCSVRVAGQLDGDWVQSSSGSNIRRPVLKTRRRRTVSV